MRYVTDGQPGIRRLKNGGEFRYVNTEGRAINDDITLKRIRSLAIPPAWTDVWICSLADGHLQATGRDARGRKQHRYHPLWREIRDATKYDRMMAFARVLPRIRGKISRDLRARQLSREKVLATIVRLMDLTFIRVGNEEYARQNHSYGLTTMKDQHARVRGDKVQFSFRGKSGKYHNIEITDRRLARIVKHCQEIPGQELFQYIASDGSRRDITSGDVNQYLREASEAEFSAKDFRTWAGTVLAAQALAACAQFETQGQVKKNVKQAITAVAEKLGNTPAVCRKCYVHPMILDGYAKKKLPCDCFHAVNGAGPAKAGLNSAEKVVLKFLQCCRREQAVEVKRQARKVAKLPEAWRPRRVHLRGRTTKAS